jgi:voltage-gated potassium channel
MSQNPLALSELSKFELVRLVLGSLVRVILGIAVILWASSLVPEKPDGTIFLPISIMAIGTFCYIMVLRRQLHKIKRSRYPSLRAFEALILLAVAFLALFSASYVIISTSNPDAFTEPLDHFTAFYFALTVLATVGFGDITPTTEVARLVSMLQMAIDIGFIAVMLKLVSTAAHNAMLKKLDTKNAPAGENS